MKNYALKLICQYIEEKVQIPTTTFVFKLDPTVVRFQFRAIVSFIEHWCVVQIHRVCHISQSYFWSSCFIFQPYIALKIAFYHNRNILYTDNKCAEDFNIQFIY